MIEIKLNRLLLTLEIKKLISNDDQLFITEDIAKKQVAVFE